MAPRSGSCPATRPGVRRMPIPIVLPTITARPKPTPRIRIRPRDAVGTAAVLVSIEDRPSLRLQRDKHDIDGAADVSRRVARAERFELYVAALPPVDDGPAVRRVLDLAARKVDDDGVGAVRV